MKRKAPRREKVTTINDDGSRYFLRPMDTKGVFTYSRRVTGYLLIAFFVSLPWITINGHPAVFLDIFHGRFYLFGLTFSSQDLWLLFFCITGLAFSLFYVTALWGRIWCGWVCPQTVYLEHVYRRIEHFIEGDGIAQRRLDEKGWVFEKIWKRGLKHFFFLIVSLIVSHIFLSYFVSIPKLYSWIQNSPGNHWKAFLFVTGSSLVLYFNFAWFREQLCIVICPYGRLQSALIDDDSVVIGYDTKRGEPRGKKGKKTDGEELEPIGDCINCMRCVNVCPTGIDIRDGLQMECVGCANCIDACNEIMNKVGRPRGLIRYDSFNGLEGRKRRILRPRIYLYTFFLILGISIALFSISRVGPIHSSIVRMQGSPYYIADDNVRNQFLVRVINKTNRRQELDVNVVAENAEISASGIAGKFLLEANEEKVAPLVLVQDRKFYNGPFEALIKIEVVESGFSFEREMRFLGPDPELLKGEE